MKIWIDKLREGQAVPDQVLHDLLTTSDADTIEYLHLQAHEVTLQNFGNNIYIRGLIEISNCCKNDCFYCGIRKSNTHVDRYRLSTDDILTCCRQGYELGFRTFVMQGGEDRAQSSTWLINTVKAIRQEFPDCAITLSLGEMPREVYQQLYDAGANRFLLRHETYDEAHYYKLHPSEMSFQHRIASLRALKEIGFQTGTGIMVGSPGQTVEHLIKDIRFIEELKPQMVGIGPFIPHKDTPFKDELAGSIERTLVLLSIFRLMLPTALIPSTTALASLGNNGRERGILAGANVVMPNLSPVNLRKNYSLYNNKAALGAESAEGLRLLAEQMKKIGYNISYERGDYKQ